MSILMDLDTREIVWCNLSRVPTAAESLPNLAPRFIDDNGKPLVESLEPEVPAPTKVYVRSSVHGKICLDGLEPETTIQQLKQLVRDRIKLVPGKELHLSSWGNELSEEWRTLHEYKLKNSCVLDMRTKFATFPAGEEEEEERGLTRLRVMSTALETRVYPVDNQTTILELKQQIHQYFLSGEHEWYNRAGERTVVTGATLLAKKTEKADERTETAAMKMGEEFVSTVPLSGEFGKGKALSVIRARRGGLPVNVMDTSLEQLILPPAEQTLSWHGVKREDEETLWALGCRTDDTIMLEFLSPTEPPILKILRAPDKPGKAKGDKKGKKGGKKKQ